MANLTREHARHTLKPGDPFTFIFPTPRVLDGAPIAVGETIHRWWSTGEPGRAFKITRITPEKAPPGIVPASIAYETTYLGLSETEVAS